MEQNIKREMKEEKYSPPGGGGEKIIARAENMLKIEFKDRGLELMVSRTYFLILYIKFQPRKKYSEINI